MRRIVWLASYPKSGNTWMRVLLTNYLRDAAEPADINKLDGGPIASARLWFDEWVGVEAAALDDAAVERLRPGVYRCLAGEARAPLYMKVHDAWRRTDRGEALFPAEVTAGVIYLVRNPLDLAASFAHHRGVDLETAVAGMCDRDFALARSHGGLADQLRQQLGSWSCHVRSWLDESGLPVQVVRYEDLLLAPQETFAKVVRSCALPCDPARLAKAVAFSSFAEVRRQEEEQGFRERSLAASGPFFRSGRAGGGRSELPSALVERLLAVHGETMARLGYLDDKGGNDHGD